LHPLKNILNRIFWDERERADDYTLTFIHRGAAGDARTMPLTQVRRVANSWFTYLDSRGNETTIPFHRVTMVKNLRSGRVLWQKKGISA